MIYANLKICSKLVPTSVYKMTDVERELMINKINNKKEKSLN